MGTVDSSWALRARKIWLIFLLLFAPCATAAVQTEDTEQLIRQGQQALEAGQAEQASLIFERVLLEQPWRLGVWVDYALSLQQMGEHASARAIYQSLLRQNPPEHLVPWLKQQAQVVAQPTYAWLHGGSLTLLSGRDSNLNRAPSADSLALTLPSGALMVLPLTHAARASAGASHLLRLDWQAARRGAEGDWLVQAALNARTASGVAGQDYLQSSLGLSYGWTDAAAREYHAALTAHHLHYGGKDIQSTLRGGLYREQPWRMNDRSACSASYGAEWEMSAYPSLHEIDGQYLGFAAGLGCKQGMDWQLLLRAGMDHAEHPRPGGNQRRTELRGQVGGRFGAGKWSALGGLDLLTDTNGYSPFLDNNAVRGIRRHLFRLEYQHPFGQGLHGLVSTETFRQRSNLPLFSLNGKAAWLGLRYLF